MKNKNENEGGKKDSVSLLETIALTLAHFQQVTNKRFEKSERFQLEMLEFKEETRNSTRELRADVNDIKAGQFTSTEKEDFLSLVRHINNRLENEALGRKDITLTRKEYDAASLAEGFQNRFEEAFQG